MSGLVWNEVECGDYRADLPLWEELSGVLPDDQAILELGCGAGRVTLHLARNGSHRVVGLDRDAELVAAVRERGHGIGAVAEHADVRNFDLSAIGVGLALAPMQLIQLLDGRDQRLCCLSSVAASLADGGRAAFAIVEALPASPAGNVTPPLPDVREADGWVYSSLPLETLVAEGRIVLRRLRQIVDPDGGMLEEVDEVGLCELTAERLEAEAIEVGLSAAGRRRVPATDAHVGSTVVLLEKGR